MALQTQRSNQPRGSIVAGSLASAVIHRTVLEQQLDHACMTTLAGKGQRILVIGGILAVFDGGHQIRVGTVFQQVFHDIVPAIAGGHDQNGLALAIVFLVVQIDLVLEALS